MVEWLDTTTTKGNEMRHTCPDGQQTKLHRHGPVGTMVGAWYTCPNCGWSRSAEGIWKVASVLRSTIVAALR